MRKSCAITLLLLLAGCGQQDMNDLKRFVAEVKAHPPRQIEPIPQIKQVATFLYVGGSRRDPFKPSEKAVDVFKVSDGTGPRPDPNRRKEELEAFPLDSLRMVGILDRKGRRYGLVRTPDGIIHRVKVGNYIGQNDGRIINIEDDKISIMELVPNGRGGYLERRAMLVLTKSS